MLIVHRETAFIMREEGGREGERSHIIWLQSSQHYLLFLDADFAFLLLLSWFLLEGWVVATLQTELSL